MCVLVKFWAGTGQQHSELVLDGHAESIDADAKQLQRIYDSLKARYRELVNIKTALLQPDNAPVHIASVIRGQLEELESLGGLPQTPYSPDLVPLDYHLFRCIAHILRGRKLFNNVNEADNGHRENFIFTPRTARIYKHGIELQA